MTPLRFLVVDDEPLAREGLRLRLGEIPGTEVVGESANAREAALAIREAAPDVLLLDVRMPGLSGFELLATLDVPEPPDVIFVTAYDRYAVKAFEVNALDYLVKPVETARLREAVERARQRLARRELARLGSRLRNVLSVLGDETLETAEKRAAGGAPREEVIPTTGPLAGRFLIREGRRVYTVSVPEVEWIESWGDYVYLHAGGRSHLLRERMKVLESGLDGRFVRIHRGTLVNLDWVVELRTRDHGEYDAVLRDGTRLRLGRRYHEAVPLLLGRLPAPSSARV